MSYHINMGYNGHGINLYGVIMIRQARTQGGGSMGSVEPPPPWRFRWFVDNNCMLIFFPVFYYLPA